jgi:hypothetical protein
MTTANPNPKPITAYCRVCGKPLTEDEARPAQGTIFCAEHAPLSGPTAFSPAPGVNSGASPGLAFLLGLIPGVGAIYNGQYAKGIVHVLIFGLLISVESSGHAEGLEALVGMLIGVFYFYMAFEAYHTARKRMMGHPVDEFSSLIQLRPEAGKVPIIPVALIGLGALFLLMNLGLLDLDKVLKFWPAALIALGIWMLYERLRGPSPNAKDPLSSEPKPPSDGGAM